MKPHSLARPLSSMASNSELASEVHLLTKALLCLPSTLSFVLVSIFFPIPFFLTALTASSWPRLT